METEESIDKAEEQIREQVEGLEDQGDRLEQKADELDRDVKETREDFDQKKSAGDVPGAQEEIHVSERESDQLPEEGPGAVDDTGRAPSEEAKESSGGASDEPRATGNPPQDDSAES